MAINIGLNSDIHVADKKLHLQTSYLEDKNCASVSIFDAGAMVTKKEFTIKKVDSAAHIEKEVAQYHELVKTDIELLFHMADKVDNSKHVPSITHLGHLFLERGFYKEAIEQFQLCGKIGGDQVNSDIELSKAYFFSGDFAAAEKCLTAAIERYPDYPDLHLLLAKTYWHQQRFE